MIKISKILKINKLKKIYSKKTFPLCFFVRNDLTQICENPKKVLALIGV